MTDFLKTYLQGDFLNERQEVKRINDIVKKVWPLFLDFAFFDSPDAKDRAGAEIAAGWPYEIKDGDDPKAPEAKKFSYSTNAMILFLIGVVLETVEPGVLVPEVSISKPESKDKQSSQEILRNGLTQIAQRSNDRKAPADSLFKSNSFGLDDPFTITWLLELLTNKSSPMGWEENEDVQQFKSKLFAVASDRLKSISKSTHPLLHWGNDLNKERRSANHMFPLLRYVQISRLLDRSANEGGSSNPEQNLAGNLLERFHNRMHYHIAQEVITTGAFDAAELAFATEGILLSKNDPQALEPDVLNRVFEIIKRRQKVSPYWRPLKPFVTTPQGFALLPLSVEVASSLLRICNFVDRDQHDESCFSEHIELFRRYVMWLQARKVKIEVRRPRDGQIRQYSGWHSEHVHGTEMIHPWETSQVLIFLLHYQAMLKEHIARASRTAAQLTFESRRRKPKKYEKDAIQKHFRGFEPLQGHWAENEDLADVSEIITYATLLHRFVAPRRPELALSNSKSPMYSALIYGPPGTGKTTLARELANALDWDLLTLTPSNFIAGGESEVESRAKDLFEMLQQQEKVVILFDEIDRLILDRESSMYLQQGDMFQFMTPSMLTKLNNLRGCKRSIYLIATNYEERIDQAVKRVGRIDCQLMLPPPDKQQRERILLEEMRKRTGSIIDDQANAQKPKRRKAARERKQQNNARELGLMKDEEDWETVLGETVLATYGELKRLVDRTVETVDPSWKKPWKARKMAKTLLAECKSQGTPAIKLKSYEPRFLSDKESDKNKNDTFITGQCPYLEFYVLVHLVQESGRGFNDEESKFLERFSSALDSDGKSVDDVIEDKMDSAIAMNVKAAFEACAGNS